MSELYTIGSVCSGKACTKCQVTKALSEFHKSGKSSDGRASWCKPCANAIYRVSRKRLYTPENKRKWQLSTRYKITPDQFATMHSAQGGLCALCPASLDKPHVDHDHNTGVVRGLLCHRCNIRLGGWDDIEWRAKAIKYLGLETA